MHAKMPPYIKLKQKKSKIKIYKRLSVLYTMIWCIFKKSKTELSKRTEKL